MDTLQSLLEQALHEDEALESQSFHSEQAVRLSGRTLECVACTFDRCTFSEWDIDRFYFMDCTFTHCDLSGLSLSNGHMSRTRLIDCRACGLTLSDSLLRDVSLSGCQLDYAVITASKLSHVAWENSGRCHTATYPARKFCERRSRASI